MNDHPPYGTNPQGQPPFGNNPQGQPPFGNNPQGQPPFGNNPQGQPPYGAPQGQPGYGPPQPGYGGPQGPQGPQGPGGWGPGPGGQQGPGGSGNKRGLLIGGAVLAVLLVVGGIASAVALTGGDDDNDSASEKESTSASVDASEVTDPADTESTDTETESSEPAPTGSGEPFSAEYNSDVGDVCNGGAMTNAAAYDADNLKLKVFRNKPGRDDYWLEDSAGYSEPWHLEYDDYEQVTVVACMKVESEGTGIPCTAKDSDDKEVKYTHVPVDYSITFVKAQTGEVLGEGDALPAGPADCPMVALIDEDGKDYSTPDEDSVLAAVNGFTFE